MQRDYGDIQNGLDDGLVCCRNTVSARWRTFDKRQLCPCKLYSNTKWWQAEMKQLFTCLNRWSFCFRVRCRFWALRWLSSPSLSGRIWGQLRGNYWSTSRCLTGCPPSPTPSEFGAFSTQTPWTASFKERYPLSLTQAPFSGLWPLLFTCMFSSWGPAKDLLTAWCWFSTLSGKWVAHYS